jgi:hypothetical protein
VEDVKQVSVLVQDATEKLDAVVAEITRKIEGDLR